MEIEKKRETSWKIQLKEVDEYIELISVEIGGEVQRIKFMLFNKEKSIKVEMSKEDFFKILTLLSAFKDVIIGDTSKILNENLKKNGAESEGNKNYPEGIGTFYQLTTEPTKAPTKNKNQEELNPEDWDPW
jgi:hypothetical protein